MIIFSKKLSFLNIKQIYFSEKPNLRFGLLTKFMQCASLKYHFGFIRKCFYTKLINLKYDDFFESFHKDTRNQIRRAKKDGILCDTTNDINFFITFYNNFLNEKKITGSVSIKNLEQYGNALILRKAYLHDGKTLVFHSYLYDHNIKRVRILHSASNLYRNTLTDSEKSLIGRANRLLHYEDMIYFKDLGYITYDLGGYAFSSDDESLKRINKFKDCFGGDLIQESNYISILLYMLLKLRQIFKRK